MLKDTDDAQLTVLTSSHKQLLSKVVPAWQVADAADVLHCCDL